MRGKRMSRTCSAAIVMGGGPTLHDCAAIVGIACDKMSVVLKGARMEGGGNKGGGEPE